jgi:hypothetical protein
MVWTFGFDLLCANQNVPRNGTVSPNRNSKGKNINWPMLMLAILFTVDWNEYMLFGALEWSKMGI